ncbi:hypothetical protein E4U58_000556 [Claviceps cyperi]|nr:hypothetical protein E4U58_000556 [Claviceps cyperi]
MTKLEDDAPYRDSKLFTWRPGLRVYRSRGEFQPLVSSGEMWWRGLSRMKTSLGEWQGGLNARLDCGTAGIEAKRDGMDKDQWQEATDLNELAMRT